MENKNKKCYNCDSYAYLPPYKLETSEEYCRKGFSLRREGNCEGYEPKKEKGLLEKL